MKPYIHAESSVQKWGGKIEDYLEVHDWFDQTKAHFGSNVHRALLHSSFGIFLAEQVFGHNITNSDDKLVSVRDIGEQHVVEDLGFIPTVSDYLENLQYKPWMSREPNAEKPSSQKSLYVKEDVVKPTFITKKPEENKFIGYDGSNLSTGIVNFNQIIDGSNFPQKHKSITGIFYDKLGDGNTMYYQSGNESFYYKNKINDPVHWSGKSEIRPSGVDKNYWGAITD